MSTPNPVSAPSTLAAFHDQHPPVESFRNAVLDGLSQTPKSLPCKFFYDEEGSRLFEEICALDEYYPTRTEMALLHRYGAEMAALMGPGCSLVEFGSGSLTKVRVLLEAMERPGGYIAVDISRAHLLAEAGALSADFPDVPVAAVCADFTRSFTLPDLGGARRIGFFPGSTIGNFTPEEAAGFLAGAAGVLRGGGLLIGVDLKKDPAILHAAYNDARGVTAAFNKNLLRRINRELGGTFDLGRFEHRAVYDAGKGRVEMHLVSAAEQTVTVDGRRFAFVAGESIHTENSYKYDAAEFEALADRAGFTPLAMWTDERRLFAVFYLSAPA